MMKLKGWMAKSPQIGDHRRYVILTNPPVEGIKRNRMIRCKN